MPDIGEGIAEVELVAWHVQPGDTVAEDQILADVMTDKATVEIPSPVAGRVLALGGEVGQMLAVGSELIRIASRKAASTIAPRRRHRRIGCRGADPCHRAGSPGATPRHDACDAPGPSPCCACRRGRAPAIWASTSARWRQRT
jgi:2-oxoisovalerate dehydrogenase E2 component (dihydrolipoyl transacylase)